MFEESPIFDGLVTFYASHHAVRAEKVLVKHGFKVMLVPGPREISPNCGVALQFEYRFADQVRDMLEKNKVQIEAIHEYQIEVSEDRLSKFRKKRLA
jgi:hypothetical protein